MRGLRTEIRNALTFFKDNTFKVYVSRVILSKVYFSRTVLLKRKKNVFVDKSANPVIIQRVCAFCINVYDSLEISENTKNISYDKNEPHKEKPLIERVSRNN